jgi:hypothetical protein
MGRPIRLTLVLSLLMFNLTAAAENPNAPTILLNPTIVTGGLRSMAIITLPSPAPSEGVMVRLAASNVLSTNESNPPMRPVASVPAEIQVPAGRRIATFQIETTPVTAAATVSISASVSDTPAVAQLSVVPPSVDRTRLNSGFVHGGNSVTGEVILTGPAPEGGFSVSLATDNGQIAITPATVTVPAGQSTATFTLQTKQVSAATWITVGASSPMVTRTAPFRVVP